MYTTQRTTSNFLQQDYLLIWIEAFSKDRRARNLSKRTIQFYDEKLKAFTGFCEAQAITQVSQITPVAIREFLVLLEGKGNNPGGIHAFYRSLKAFMNWYWSEAEPDFPNPMLKVKAPRVPEKQLDAADHQDVLSMMETCENTLVGKRDKAIMLFLLDSGVRAKELLGIRMEDVDILSGEVHIKQTKGGVPRNVYLGATSLRALRRYLKIRKDNCPELWIKNDSQPLHFWGLVEIMRRRAEIAHVPQPSLHSFRRWWAVSFLRSGGTVFALQKAGGWKSFVAMRPYLKLMDSDIQKAMQDHSPVDNLK